MLNLNPSLNLLLKICFLGGFAQALAESHHHRSTSPASIIR
jgi:hypothetical protein